MKRFLEPIAVRAIRKALIEKGLPMRAVLDGPVYIGPSLGESSWYHNGGYSWTTFTTRRFRWVGYSGGLIKATGVVVAETDEGQFRSAFARHYARVRAMERVGGGPFHVLLRLFEKIR